MVLDGVYIILGYKISEEDLRAEFEEGFEEYIVTLKHAEDKKKRRKKADAYVYEFCKYEFDKYLNFLMYGSYDKNNSHICFSMPCCEYKYNNNWVIGLKIKYFDGFEFTSYDLTNTFNRKNDRTSVKKIYKKLGLEVMFDGDEPEFFAIANDCKRCS